MIDPLGSFETIKENFIRYVQTAFGTKFQGVEDERYALLNRDRVFYRMPWIEPLPDYKSSGKRIDDLKAADFGGSLTDAEIDTFKGLVKTGLFPDFAKLHAHQAEMLKTVLQRKNCVITSGTGSGKTESFLLPLFAQLSKELTKWPVANRKSPSCDSWWNESGNGGLTPAKIIDGTDFTLSNDARQRAHETRPAGVRALILYPMNALVEDQMTRLRKALDSDDTRTWLASPTIGSGNAIYFGRYNGNTPVAGELSKIKEGKTVKNINKVGKLTDALRKIDKDAERVSSFIDKNSIVGDEAKDLKSFFPRLNGAEMRCRFDMQLAPPDILITNYSMLSIMLMREIDSAIFDTTKAWLNCQDIQDENKREAEKKNRVFHLIIDELHLYRGTSGTEVSYLIRLVIDRLGLHPNHDQLRILASSASLEPKDQKSQDFLKDFFGTDDALKPFTIIEGENNLVSPLDGENNKLPTLPFRQIAKAYEACKGVINDSQFMAACDSAANLLASQYEITTSGIGIEKLLNVLIDDRLQLKERLYSPCAIEQDAKISYKAVCSLYVEGSDEESGFYSDSMFEFSNRNELPFALRGLFIARALLDENAYKQISDNILPSRTLPRFRFHYFFRNIEGMWASTSTQDNVAEAYEDSERTMGELYATSHITSANGRRVLELLYCDNCGTTLFGGSRLVTREGQFELLPISPNIEGVPEKTPAKLVEKRSYQEYGVFWPCGQQPFTPHDRTHGIPMDYWRQTTIGGIDQNEYEAKWVEASLHTISGDVDLSHDKAEDTSNPDLWVKGYVFAICKSNSSQDIACGVVHNDVLIETHRALPNACPSCGVNHQNPNNKIRKSKTTSIRGFRTGFAKTTQMFAKELMYQLPDEADKRKLVVFSDSREDAAQIANGIERNHFTDLLREVLVDTLHKKIALKSLILAAIESDNTEQLDSLRNTNIEDVQEMEELIDDSVRTANSSRVIKIQNDAIRDLAKIRHKIFSVRELADTTNSSNLAPLVKAFAELGINPGGNNLSIQTQLRNNDYVPWYELIDFQNNQWAAGANPGFIRAIKEGNYEGLAGIFFGSLFYSFESSALGYLTIDPSLEIIGENAGTISLSKETFLQILNGVIRILGDKYKHNKSDYDLKSPITSWVRFPSPVKKYIEAVASNLSKSTTELSEAIFKTLIDGRLMTENKGLIIEELFIKIASASDNVWMSNRGKRPHLHLSGGICTYSHLPLVLHPNCLCEDLWAKNYLSYTAIKEQRKPIRLHCEELTGQTDDQFSRQRHFRNIILPDEGNSNVKKIDLLSVTTTLEVGVDIGALQAVMLGNMPPQRFNYQQRVGRAGRRGQAYSVILTFCRGRSHDEFYFANPQKITGDAPPTPFLTMGQERIYKRLLAKEVLRQAYKTIIVNPNNDEGKSTIHGVFGKTFNWVLYKLGIVDWIRNNSSLIGRIVDSLLTPQLLDRRMDLIDWTQDTGSNDGLLGKAQAIISNTEIATDDISEKLAEGGLLPMFGMPTTVRNLYHTIKNLNPLTIDRPQSMAIYEFAPGSQKTKDKSIHTSIGFTNSIISTYNSGGQSLRASESQNGVPFSLNRWFVRCRGCGFFETYSEEDKALHEPSGRFTACVNCGESELDKYQPPMMLKAPVAYRTDLSLGSDSKEDSEIILSRPPIFAERGNNDDAHFQCSVHSNTALSISDKAVTWRINTNSDNFFIGRLATTTQIIPQAGNIILRNQWITNDAISQLADTENQNGYLIKVNPQGDDQSIALASNKNTEVLRIAPLKLHPALDLNMFAYSNDLAFIKAHSAGVRAGYYSAAFLLQRIIADRLDIDPTEVEVADIIMKVLDDERKVAEIILTDELPNGSGFVRYLFTNFKTIIEDTLGSPIPDTYLGKIHSALHSSKCQDACYDCLKAYRNMGYHSLLDWRLGFSLLRTMNDLNYACGADGDFSSFIELRNWKTFAKKLRDGFAKSFNMRDCDELEGLPFMKIGPSHRRDTIMLVHPFWDLANIREENWLARIKDELEIIAAREGGIVRIVDTFNLHRRPGWCYEKLVKG